MSKTWTREEVLRYADDAIHLHQEFCLKHGYAADYAVEMVLVEIGAVMDRDEKSGEQTNA